MEASVREIVKAKPRTNGKAPQLTTFSGRQPLDDSPVLLHRFTITIGWPRASYSRRLVTDHGATYFRHWDLPSGGEKCILTGRDPLGKHTISSPDADYLREQEQIRRMNYISLVEVMRRSAGVKSRDKTNLTMAKDFYRVNMEVETVEVDGVKRPETYLCLPVFSEEGGIRKCRTIKFSNEWLFEIADANFIIEQEQRRLRDYVTVKWLAKKLDVSGRTIHNWRAAGRVSGIAFGKEVYLSWASVLPLLPAEDFGHKGTAYVVPFDSIPKAVELLGTRVDRAAKLIRLTQLSDCPNDEYAIGVKYTEANNAKILVTRDAADIIRFYVALTEAGEKALDVFSSVYKRVSESAVPSEVDAAKMLIAKFKYMTCNMHGKKWVRMFESAKVTDVLRVKVYDLPPPRSYHFPQRLKTACVSQSFDGF